MRLGNRVSLRPLGQYQGNTEFSGLSSRTSQTAYVASFARAEFLVSYVRARGRDTRLRVDPVQTHGDARNIVGNSESVLGYHAPR